MRKYGVLVISHGSRDEQWVALVREACNAVSSALPKLLGGVDMPLECSFLELVHGHLIQDGIDRLERQGVTDMLVIPLFISSGSTHIDEITWALGAKPEPILPTELTRLRMTARLHLCAPIDDDPEIARLLADKLKSITIEPERELVMLVGHGSNEEGFHAKWHAGLASLAAQVKAIGGYAEADIAMLLPDQAAAKMNYWKAHRPDLTVLIAPLFLSAGYFTTKVIPQRFAAFTYRYSGATLLPSPHVAGWMERRIVEKFTMIEVDG